MGAVATDVVCAFKFGSSELICNLGVRTWLLVCYFQSRSSLIFFFSIEFGGLWISQLALSFECFLEGISGATHGSE